MKNYSFSFLTLMQTIRIPILLPDIYSRPALCINYIFLIMKLRKDVEFCTNHVT